MCLNLLLEVLQKLEVKCINLRSLARTENPHIGFKFRTKSSSDRKRLAKKTIFGPKPSDRKRFLTENPRSYPLGSQTHACVTSSLSSYMGMEPKTLPHFFTF